MNAVKFALIFSVPELKNTAALGELVYEPPVTDQFVDCCAVYQLTASVVPRLCNWKYFYVILLISKFTIPAIEYIECCSIIPS